MKKLLIIPMFTFTFGLHLLPAATYTLTGERYLRKYTAPSATQVYNAETDAQRVADNLCDVPWVRVGVVNAQATSHVSTNLDANVANRDSFDAALFCANHVGDTHRAYANAAVYRFDLGEGTLPRLTALAASVFSDPYNAYGARIVLMTNATGAIPTECATVRGDVTGGIKMTNVAARITRTSGSKDYWYPNSSNVVFSAAQLGASGLQLQRYLLVFVLMENYATSRGNWLEGSSYIENAVTLTTSAAIPSMTASCDVDEPYATNFNLKDGHSSDDDDGDGLSNYSEYLVTHVFRFATLDPTVAATDGTCPDFFRKSGNLYFGQMFSGMWGQPSNDDYAPTTYNAAVAAFDPANDTLPLKLGYAGKRRVRAAVIVRCWMESRDADMSGAPDTTWKLDELLVNGSHRVSATAAMRVESGCLGTSLEGPCKFEVFADENGDGAFTPGEPFAFLRGEAGAELDARLADTSEVFARIDLTSGKCDRATRSADDTTVRTLDAATAATLGVVPTDWLSGETRSVRVRVVRALVDGSNVLGKDRKGNNIYVDQVVVMDKSLDLSVRGYIHEGDFLSTNSFDIGWSDLQEKVYGRDTEVAKYVDATNITYMIVMGEGDIVTGGSNTVFRSMISRVYDSATARQGGFEKPVIDTTQPSYAYGAKPTFRWAMQDMNGVNCNSYTAFKLQIRNGSTTVYDSGYRCAPARGSDGWYEWKLDEPLGSKVGTGTNYTWRVAMFNAKFRDDTFWSNKTGSTVTTWSDSGAFVVDMNQMQAMNDHGYSTIAATVKYAGPASALTGKRVVLQAFDNPFFAGAACGEAFVSSGVANTASTAANAAVLGLPATGSYYLRAFVDANGNGVKDDWESWGHGGASVALRRTTTAAPKASVYIEDADTDGDWMPDAWEYVTYGSLTNRTASIIGGDNIRFNGAASSAEGNVTDGIEGASMTTFQNKPLTDATVPALTTTVSVEDLK